MPLLIYDVEKKVEGTFRIQFACELLNLIAGRKAGYAPLNVEKSLRVIIGIKHGFSCINIRHVPWEVLKTVAEGCGFQHLPRYLANVNALKKHVRSLLLHKN